jgi:Ca-activated chloride channel homolog
MSHSLQRRVVLLAVAQLCCAGVVEAAHAGGRQSAWSDLWFTPDQQGRALLDAGQPANAAARFHDPRWQAYADLQAARYRQAAKLLAPFTDADSEYNHGNALAESGQLQAALAVYDAALKLAPADRDIRHNRDLVERALRQQQQSRGNGSGAQQSGGHNPHSTGGGRPGSNAARAGSGQSGSSGQQPDSPRASSERRAGDSREAPGEARRDATFAKSVARARQQQGGSRHAGRADDSRAAGGTEMPQPKSASERQLMLDEWLRQIPDSPAGLLQRQFLIDHMSRQQNGPAGAP